MKTKRIAGWDIYLDHFRGAKNLSDLKNGIGKVLFDTLPKEEKSKAFDELWSIVKPEKISPVKAEKPEDLAGE